MTSSGAQPARLSRRRALAAMAGTAGVAAIGGIDSPKAAADEQPVAEEAVLPEFWYQDNNLGHGWGIQPDFFSRYDEMDTWTHALKVMDGFCLPQNLFVQRHLDQDLPFMEKLAAAHAGRGFAYNVTQVVAWWWPEYKKTGVVPAGPPDFTATVNQLRRLRSMGIETTDIILQSVLTKPGPGHYLGYMLDRRIADVVQFFDQARPFFPHARIGLIDPLPGRSAGGMFWQDAYRLVKAELASHGHELSFIHFDKPFDRARHEVVNPIGLKITWDLIVEVGEFIQNELGMIFGLQCADVEAGNISNNAFRQYILDGVATYVEHGGRADRYVLWPFFPYPDHSIPDSLGPLPPEGASQLRIFRELARGPAYRRRYPR